MRKYNYDSRIIFLVQNILDCCGGISANTPPCSVCTLKLEKCARMFQRSGMMIPEYLSLIRQVPNGMV